MKSNIGPKTLWTVWLILISSIIGLLDCQGDLTMHNKRFFKQEYIQHDPTTMA
jgi:hypothetical protein